MVGGLRAQWLVGRKFETPGLNRARNWRTCSGGPASASSLERQKPHFPM